MGNQRHFFHRVGRTICVVDVDEVEVWQYITSGLRNQSLISHLEFPTTKIGPLYQWYCSLIGHHSADLSTWCNTLIRHGKTRKMCGRRQCADRERTLSNKQVSIASELCGLYENALNIVVKEYDGQVLIHLRNYSKAAGEDRWYPTKTGVTLNLAEWDTFNQSFFDIDCEVRRLRCKNAQVQSPPSRGIKEILIQLLVGKMYECMPMISTSHMIKRPSIRTGGGFMKSMWGSVW